MQRYTLIGFPVAHSESPAIHNAWFRAKGVAAVYEKCAVAPGELASVMQRFAETYAGGNVTLPHKTAVMEHLDEIDRTAEAIGAANTIVTRDGRTVGHNTDAVGTLCALAEGFGLTPAPSDRRFLRGKHVLILGAGGAARAVAHAVADCARIVIANRTLSRAKDLAASIGAEAVCLADAAATPADIVINATSVGLWPHGDTSPLPQAAWPVLARNPELVAMDLVAKPAETRFLRDAAACGVGRCVAGDRILLYQAAAAFELWTGFPPLGENTLIA